MKNNFYYYHKQNEIILKLVLLPFTLIIFIIKKLVQTTKKRYVTRKHQPSETLYQVRFENKKLAYNFTQVFFIYRSFLLQILICRYARYACYAPIAYHATLNAPHPNRRGWAPRVCYARPARGLSLLTQLWRSRVTLFVFATLHPHKGGIAQLNGLRRYGASLPHTPEA